MRQAKKEGINSKLYLDSKYYLVESGSALRAEMGDRITPGELSFLKEKLPSKQVCRFLRNADTVLSVVEQDSFYPHLQRKERKERILDQMVWREKHGHYSNAYNEYGLDIVGFRNPDDYLDRYEFRELKDGPHHGGVDPKRYEMVSVDKLLFYSYMEKAAPGITPKVHFAFSDGRVVAPYGSGSSIADALQGLAAGAYACKVRAGQKGKGFYKIEKTSEGRFVFDDGECSRGEFFKSIRKGSYILQDYIEQDPSVSRLSPAGVSTIRIATVRCGTRASVFYSLLRMSSTPNAKVDNASQGGTFVGIEDQTGRLRKFGFYDDDVHYRNTIETHHPVSGLEYEGFQLPLWGDVVSLVKDLHKRFFRGFMLIGWDVALTENGPVVLEINTNPCTKMAQIANGGLQRKWNELSSRE